MKIEYHTWNGETHEWDGKPAVTQINPARIICLEDGWLSIDGAEQAVKLTEQSCKDVTEWLERYAYYLAPLQRSENANNYEGTNKMKEIKVKVTYLDELLGTANADPDVHERWIASNAPDALSTAEEIAAIGAEEFAEKSTTIFPRNENGECCTFDYQWRGYFKEACSMLRRAGSAYKSSKLKAFKKEIDGLVFVEPRMIPLQMPEGQGITHCQRPLRASTAQGDLVALANSEAAPAGTTQEFTVVLLKDDLEPLVLEWLEYGKYHGTGQWRNSGKGRFVFEVIGD